MCTENLLDRPVENQANEVVKSNLVSSYTSAVYLALAMWSTRARVVGTSFPCSFPPRRMGPTMASSSGVRPAATSFCIELRRESGAPSSAARTGWGVSLAPSAIATEQASVTHDSRRECQPASDRTAPSVPPEAVVDRANGARKHSLPQSIDASSP
jgi:hypothetical protein